MDDRRAQDPARRRLEVGAAYERAIALKQPSPELELAKKRVAALRSK
jgi:hypothetical protein